MPVAQYWFVDLGLGNPCHRASSKHRPPKREKNSSFLVMLLMVASASAFLLSERILHPFFSVFYWLMIWIVLTSLGICLAPVLSASRVSKNERAHIVEFTHEMQWANLENASSKCVKIFLPVFLGRGMLPSPI